VASRSGEIPHVVAYAGVLFDVRNVLEWTDAIDRLLGDAGHRRDLSERGLSRAHERFALPVVARAHLSFFEELL
jgi:glycosyltransferase involved in cell wall biosynthesis